MWRQSFDSTWGVRPPTKTRTFPVTLTPGSTFRFTWGTSLLRHLGGHTSDLHRDDVGDRTGPEGLTDTSRGIPTVYHCSGSRGRGSTYKYVSPSHDGCTNGPRDPRDWNSVVRRRPTQVSTKNAHHLDDRPINDQQHNGKFLFCTCLSVSFSAGERRSSVPSRRAPTGPD